MPMGKPNEKTILTGEELSLAKRIRRRRGEVKRTSQRLNDLEVCSSQNTAELGSQTGESMKEKREERKERFLKSKKGGFIEAMIH